MRKTKTILLLITTAMLLTAALATSQLLAENIVPQPKEYGPNIRTLTVTGTIDPRLSAIVITTYRPTDYDEKNSACTRSDWNTARRKGMLDWEYIDIKPDEHSRYKVTVPIDYVREDRCGYEFVNTAIQIQRDKRDDRFAKITLLSDSHENYDNYGSKGTNLPDEADVRSRKTAKPHYHLAQGTYIQCHTDYFESTQDVLFNCYPLGGNGDHGLDEITSTRMKVDVRINETISEYVFDSRIKPGSKKDHFRDYVPPPPGFFERVKQRVEQLLN